jgi:glycosyltransferase involved in cell wall biosynthesis
LNERFVLPLWKRIINHLFLIFPIKNVLKEALLKANPDLVILSQGNNIGSEHIMLLCRELKYRYVVITHLVAESNWAALDNETRIKSIEGYSGAVKCFFVSQANKNLHDLMLGYVSNNTEIVYNPVSTESTSAIQFPNFDEGLQVAVAGRLECFHKGIDILLNLAGMEKWKSRQITFNLYGDGPHKEIIESTIQSRKLNNVLLHGHLNNVVQIWEHCHLMLLPSRMEGQSISLSEALSLNRTVVATNVGGVTELITNNETGFIAQSPSVESVDEAMERAWNRQKELERIGKKAGEEWKRKVPQDPIRYFNDRIKRIL